MYINLGKVDLSQLLDLHPFKQTSIPCSDVEHDGCARVCHFALDLMGAMRIYNCDIPIHDKIELRVGIGTGQVVAGEDYEHLCRIKVVLFLISTPTICAG